MVVYWEKCKCRIYKMESTYGKNIHFRQLLFNVLYCQMEIILGIDIIKFMIFFLLENIMKQNLSCFDIDGGK